MSRNSTYHTHEKKSAEHCGWKKTHGMQNLLSSGVFVWWNAVFSDRSRRVGGNYAKFFPDKPLHINC